MEGGFFWGEVGGLLTLFYLLMLFRKLLILLAARGGVWLVDFFMTLVRDVWESLTFLILLGFSGDLS